MDITEKHIEDLHENCLFLSRMLGLISFVPDERFRVDAYMEITKAMKEGDIDYEEVFLNKKEAIERHFHRHRERIDMNKDRHSGLKGHLSEAVENGEFYSVVEKLIRIVYEDISDSRVLPPINSVTSTLMNVRKEGSVEKIKERLHELIKDVFDKWNEEIETEEHHLNNDETSFHKDAEIVAKEFSISTNKNA